MRAHERERATDALPQQVQSHARAQLAGLKNPHTKLEHPQRIQKRSSNNTPSPREEDSHAPQSTRKSSLPKEGNDRSNSSSSPAQEGRKTLSHKVEEMSRGRALHVFVTSSPAGRSLSCVPGGEETQQHHRNRNTSSSTSMIRECTSKLDTETWPAQCEDPCRILEKKPKIVRTVI